jgi:hypothetical protein
MHLDTSTVRADTVAPPVFVPMIMLVAAVSCAERHADALSASLPASDAVIHPKDGHISVLRSLNAHLRGRC